MPPRERLPEHHAHGPDVAGGGSLLACEPLRRDVRERAGDVADGGQGLGLGEGREAEVEQPHGDRWVVGDQHVGRLHVAVDDPAAVRVREPLRELGAGLDQVGVAELLRAEGVAEGEARGVLVGDVDVAALPAEGVGAQAGRVPEPRGRLGLPLRPEARLALPGHDLQGDVEPRLLVPGEPDRAAGAASQGAKWAVAAQGQIGPWGVGEGLGHGSQGVKRPGPKSCAG